jgi:hypothetical protein
MWSLPSFPERATCRRREKFPGRVRPRLATCQVPPVSQVRQARHRALQEEEWVHPADRAAARLAEARDWQAPR